MSRHPIQPIERDSHGTLRFKKNAIVDKLLSLCSAQGFGLNDIALGRFDHDDRVQFAQLIGYSVSGFSSLGYADEDTMRAVDLMMVGANEKDARVESLSAELEAMRAALREPMARLFGVHPEDLGAPPEPPSIGGAGSDGDSD